MIKKIFLFMILGLGFSACQKEGLSVKELSSEETFVLNGEVFKVDETRGKLSLIFGLDEKQFEFVRDSIAFEYTYGHSGKNKHMFYLEPIIDAIKQVEL